MVEPSQPPSLWDAFRTGLKGLKIHWKAPGGESFDQELTAATSEARSDESVPVRQASAGRSTEVPYVPFDREIPASDIVSINQQQTARNAAFIEWVRGICDQLTERGYSPDVSFDEPGENWYVLPVTAKVEVPETGRNIHLCLYHYDAWQGLDAASRALEGGVFLADSV